MPDALPADVREFLGRHIRSVAQLELLLLMQAQPQKFWSIQEAAKELYIAASMTEPLLEHFRASGFVCKQDGVAGLYQYAPATPGLKHLIEKLARLYPERRVTVLNAIYSAPTGTVQDFADAFRIRKEGN